jgi:hypothetical protein
MVLLQQFSELSACRIPVRDCHPRDRAVALEQIHDTSCARVSSW